LRTQGHWERKCSETARHTWVSDRQASSTVITNFWIVRANQSWEQLKVLPKHYLRSSFISCGSLGTDVYCRISVSY